jgi:signal peptidase I
MASQTQQSGRSSLIELVTIVGLALGLFLIIQGFLVKPFRIPSESMVPTLAVGQRVLVDRVTFRFGNPERDDVVVFKPPAGADDESSGEAQCGAPRIEGQACSRPTPKRSDTNFIKRVVGVGGDRIKVLGSHVYVNGQRQKEPFARFSSSCDICNLPDEITVPKGYYFMMGDNRGASADSRVWGPIPKDWVIGQAFATYWPPGKIGTL